MPTTYQAVEREETSIPITEVLRDGEIDILPEVQNQKYFEIRFKGSRLSIVAGKYVGIIPLNNRVSIEVQPKIPVSNLVQILAAVDAEIRVLDILERSYRVSQTVPNTILEAMAAALIACLQRIQVEGLAKRYMETTTDGSLIRGQILFGESLQRLWSQGLRHRAVSRFFELSADTRENRLLRYACRLLLVHFHALGKASALVRHLAYFDEYFHSVGVNLARPEPQAAISTLERMSPTYLKGLGLALSILKSRGVELPVGGTDILLPSFLIDMETLFEEYTRFVLKTRLKGFTVLDGNREGRRPLFDDRPAPTASPDIVTCRDGVPVLVADVKYKPRWLREDLNQILGYALAYKVKTVLLILPIDTPSATTLSLVGEVNSIRIFEYQFRLGANNLAESEENLTVNVRSLLPSSSAAATAA